MHAWAAAMLAPSSAPPGLDEGDVVPLEHDPAQHLLRLPLQMHLGGFVQNQVHVLVEADYMSFNPGVNVLVEPDGHSGPVLQVPEDQVDGLHHHLLDLLTASVGHPPC